MGSSYSSPMNSLPNKPTHKLCSHFFHFVQVPHILLKVSISNFWFFSAIHCYVFPYCSKLSREQLLQKLKRLEADKKKMGEKLIRLNKKVSQFIKRDAVEIDSETSKIVEETMEKVDSPFEADSAQHLLWEQQRLQNSLSNKKGMRWHPLIIRWCLSIYLKSPGTYKSKKFTVSFFALQEHSTKIH